MAIHRYTLTRDLVMFVAGLIAFLYEVLNGGDRPNIIYAAMAMMGAAAYLRGVTILRDEEKKKP